jgi:glycosyltransferase involved in cell wall biosynthesis
MKSRVISRNTKLLPESLPTMNILLIALVGEGFGGLETHVLNLCKQLSDRGHTSVLLAFANSPLHRRIRQAGLTCHTIPYYKFPGFYRTLNFLLPGILVRLCKKYDIQIIQCNNRFELPSAIRTARLLKTKVIFNYHVTDQIDSRFLKGIDAFISPGRNVVRYVEETNRMEKLGIQQIRVIPPLFDADKFITYRSYDAMPDKWFAATFGISLKPCPVICSIGNMVTDLQHKNYPLLFEAIANLIHIKKIPVQAVLAGDGPVRPFLQNLARSLDIQEYVHFLGFINEHTPGVLYHSDIFVLASSREAFGIVFLEAGLMHKPAIGARNTGAQLIIDDEKTGLLFENGDMDSLAARIQRLVEDPLLAHQIGNQAYQHVIQNFVPAVVIRQYEALYAALLCEAEKFN